MSTDSQACAVQDFTSPSVYKLPSNNASKKQPICHKYDFKTLKDIHMSFVLSSRLADKRKLLLKLF